MTAAARLRRHRERAAAGRSCLTVEVDEIGLAAALVQAQMLSPEDEGDKAAIKRALEKTIELWIGLK